MREEEKGLIREELTPAGKKKLTPAGLAIEQIQKPLAAFAPEEQKKILLRVAKLLGLNLQPETETVEV